MNQSRIKSLGIAGVVFILFSASDAFCWGQSGHRIVGEIAQNHLTAKAKKKIHALFNEHNREGAIAQTNDHLLAKISTWADEIRSDHSMDHYKPWHYINLEDG